MTMCCSLLQSFIYNSTLVVFYFFYFLFEIVLELCYHTYLATVETVIITVTDALWSTKFLIVRIACRFVLAPHSILLHHNLNDRHVEMQNATYAHRAALDAARMAADILTSLRGYCFPELQKFVQIQLRVVCSGIKLKVIDGKRERELEVLSQVRTRYSKPLKGDVVEDDEDEL